MTSGTGYTSGSFLAIIVNSLFYPPNLTSAKPLFCLHLKVNSVFICILCCPLVICRHSPGTLIFSDESALSLLEYETYEGGCYLDLTKMLSR